MAKRRQNRIARICVSLTGLFFCAAFGSFFLPRADLKIINDNSAERTQKKEFEIKAAAKFTDFPHGRHSKLECSSCHKFPSANWKRVRKPAEAFPDITEYPKHESCLNCHRQQFFGTPKPTICAICHTNPSPNNSSRYPFPNPREIFDLSAKGKQAVSDFQISFPHDLHIDIVSRNKDGNEGFTKASFNRRSFDEKSCSVCHQTYNPQDKSNDEYATKPPAKLGDDDFWLKKGTFKTVPVSHANCFTCHSQETGILPAPQSCAVCHKLAQKIPKTDFDAQVAATMGSLDKITLDSWRKRDSSAKFRHELSSHSDMECANCHNAAAIKTIDFTTKKVAITSCNLCHITEKTDDGGILNFEVDARKKDAKFQCVKCHIAYGKMPIPESHLKAIADSGK